MFYVYVYLDPLFPNKCNYDNYVFDHTPIYIGKGKGKRVYDHLKKTNNPVFTNKIAYWKRNNIEPIIIKLQENLTEIGAWNLEVKLIKLIGRFDLKLGSLLNLTNGGEGATGITPWNKGKKGAVIVSDETRKRLSKASKGKKKSQLHCENISAGLKGKTKSEEHRKKLSEANIGHTSPNKGLTGIWTEEQLLVQSEKMKEWWTLERKMEKSEQQKGKKLSEEHKANLAKAMEIARHPHTDDTKLIMSQKKKEYWKQKKANIENAIRSSQNTEEIN